MDSFKSRRRQRHPTPVLLPGKSHGWRSLVGCSPWGRKESDTTEQFHFHFSLSCTVEGNGNPLQCSCLENPRDGGAWWAAVYGVAQSQTWLKWLSSSGKASLVSPSITESISQGHCPAQEKRTRENSMPQGQPVLPSKDWPSSVNCWKELHGQSWGRNSALFIFHPVRIKTRTQST